MAFKDEKLREQNDRARFHDEYRREKARKFAEKVSRSAEATREKLNQDNTPAACAWRLAERNRIAENDPENAFQLEFAF